MLKTNSVCKRKAVHTISYLTYLYVLKLFFKFWNRYSSNVTARQVLASHDSRLTHNITMAESIWGASPNNNLLITRWVKERPVCFKSIYMWNSAAEEDNSINCSGVTMAEAVECSKPKSLRDSSGLLMLKPVGVAERQIEQREGTVTQYKCQCDRV